MEKEWDFKQDEKDVEMIKEAVRSIRGVRTEMNVPPSKKSYRICSGRRCICKRNL